MVELDAGVRVPRHSLEIGNPADPDEGPRSRVRGPQHVIFSPCGGIIGQAVSKHQSGGTDTDGGCGKDIVSVCPGSDG